MHIFNETLSGMIGATKNSSKINMNQYWPQCGMKFKRCRLQ
uniref:Uncharacterized protein n=1 Tax=Rhizophora mucronata TaxID=61149 RepID=A0A2P2P4F9_RHIMU